MRVIPAIDIIDGKCVRLQQGDYTQKKIYNEDPLAVAKEFEQAGLQYLHLVDLDGAKSGKVVNWKVVETLAQKTDLIIDFGGGVKTQDEFSALLAMGVQQINLGSIAVKSPETVESFIAEYGAARIILSADVKDKMVAIHGWMEDSALDVFDFIKSYDERGVHNVTCTDIAVDGMLSGPNVRLYREILTAFPLLNLIASGGVGTVSDLENLSEAGVDGVIIGKAIYEGKITLEQLTNFM